MSEFISLATRLDGDPQRISALVRVILDYFDGQDIADLQKRISIELGTITPAEMAYAVQMLADSEQAIGDDAFTDGHELLMHMLLDGAMVSETKGGLPPGHPVDTLIAENRAVSALVDVIRERASGSGSQMDESWWANAIERLWQVDVHYTRKENQLFPFLEKAGFDRPSNVMWTVHDEIRSEIKQHLEYLASGRLDESMSGIGDLLDAVADMITKEEMVLYPISLQLLDDAAWAEIHRGDHEIGYCLIDKPTPWLPRPVLETSEDSEARTSSGAAPRERPVHSHGQPQRPRTGTVGIDGGSLTPEELNLLLQHVPLDITFVDEFDEVQFYNRGSERVFPRSAGIIGREVRYCHPPKSVHIVLEIVSEFKAGNRDTAEFWIQMRDSFIHIRYFAVRDDAGSYRGVIEVSQDVTHLRRDFPSEVTV